MIIRSYVLNKLLEELPDKPPEVGGVIGGTKEEITTYWLDDVQRCECKMCSYSPNVDSINKVIKEWQNINIRFLGLFHTHYFSVNTLSDGDIDYMKRIIRNMPENIEKLYFPIVVFPEKEMTLYVMEKDNEIVYKLDYRLV